MCNAHGHTADSWDRKYGVAHGNPVEVIICNKAELHAELEHRDNVYNSRTFNVIILNSGCTRHMLAHKCYCWNMK